MVCIYCSGTTNVANSRLQKRSNNTWRRRVCNDCGAIVTTIERIDLETAITVVSDGSPQPFSRDKLLISIFESCRHRDDASSSATSLTDTVIKQLHPLISAGAVSLGDIRKTSASVLARFDEVAGVHYRAYHRG